jgi:hypothetical protein
MKMTYGGNAALPIDVEGEKFDVYEASQRDALFSVSLPLSKKKSTESCIQIHS